MIPNLFDTLLLLHVKHCSLFIVVVVGRIWFRSFWLLHHGSDCCHVQCSISNRKTTHIKKHVKYQTSRCDKRLF